MQESGAGAGEERGGGERGDTLHGGRGAGGCPQGGGGREGARRTGAWDGQHRGMDPLHAPEISVIRADDRRSDPPDYRRVREAREAKTVLRITPGTFVKTADWCSLDPLSRQRMRVTEASRRLRDGTVFSRYAAAALWGIDILGRWPGRIDVRVSRASGGRSSGLIRRRTMGSDNADLRPWGRHFLTSPAQTAIDIASSSPFVNGVVVLDQARWRRRPGGAVTTVEERRRVVEG